MSKGRVIRTVTEELPVRLSPEELRDRGERLASLQGQLGDHLVDAKAKKGDLKQTETELRADINKLAGHIRRKEEPRQVEVEVRHVGKSEVHEVRTDTGEVVRRRGLDEHERQPELIPVGDA